MEENPPECVFRTQNPHEAELVRSALEAAGIRAFVFDGRAAGSVAMFGPAIMSRVMVAAPDKAAALKLIAEREGK